VEKPQGRLSILDVALFRYGRTLQIREARLRTLALNADVSEWPASSARAMTALAAESNSVSARFPDDWPD